MFTAMSGGLLTRCFHIFIVFIALLQKYTWRAILLAQQWKSMKNCKIDP